MAPVPRLHVNIDHVATVREARGGALPDPIAAATLAELGGARGITVHLREDRRHICNRDVTLLRQTVTTLLNLEMSLSAEIVAFALEIRPDQVCLVPEKREELTTEGGLDVVAEKGRLMDVVPALREAGIEVSLFTDPEEAALDAAADVGADFVELHTGTYANTRDRSGNRTAELDRLMASAEASHQRGLRVNAGHGLDYGNVDPVVQLPHLEELNIGHAIVARSVLVGLERAVREMCETIEAAMGWST